jgi:hypothetical protein
VAASLPICGWGPHSPFWAATFLTVVLLGVIAFGYLAELIAGRQWLVLHENGFVHADRHAELAVPWARVLGVRYVGERGQYQRYDAHDVA